MDSGIFSNSVHVLNVKLLNVLALNIRKLNVPAANRIRSSLRPRRIRNVRPSLRPFCPTRRSAPPRIPDVFRPMQMRPVCEKRAKIRADKSEIRRFFDWKMKSSPPRIP